MHQDFRTPPAASDAIGFRELRQACEISALREDLERVHQNAGTLCEHIEEAVENVRSRFAGLTPEELADAASMLPLLQFAITQLISIRERARRMDITSGALSDEARSYWDAAGPASRVSPQPPAQAHAPTIAAAATAEPPPPPHSSSPAQSAPPPFETPSATAPASPTWLTSTGEAPRAPRPHALPMPHRPPPSSATIDWLAPKSD